MIKVTRLNGKEFWVNPHQIEFMEETPDTILKLQSGANVMVLEKAHDVLERIVAYRRLIGPAGNEAKD